MQGRRPRHLALMKSKYLAPAGPLAGAFRFDPPTFRCAMTYNVVVISSVYVFIGVAMLATLWDMGR